MTKKYLSSIYIFYSVFALLLYSFCFANAYSTSIKNSDLIFLNTRGDSSKSVKIKAFDLKKSSYFAAQLDHFADDLTPRGLDKGYNLYLETSQKDLVLIKKYLVSPNDLTLDELASLVTLADFYGLNGFSAYHEHRMQFPNTGYKQMLLNKNFGGDMHSYNCPYKNCRAKYPKNTYNSEEPRYTDFLNHLTLSHGALVKSLVPQGAFICLPTMDCIFSQYYYEGEAEEPWDEV